MNAVISGRAGTALLIDGNSLFSFDVDDVNTVVPRQQSDLPFLLGDGVDLQFLENIEPNQVKQQLELAYDSACALDLMLILLDSELSDEVRKEAAEELEALFADTQIAERLENLLYARPLPEAADIIGALDRSEEVEAAKVKVVTQNLLERQPFIREVSLAWNAIPADNFGGEEQKAEFQRAAINEGLFRVLVIAYLDEKVNEFLLDALGRPAIRALRNYRIILQQWASGFRSRTATPEIQEDEEEFDTESPQGRERRRRRLGVDRAKVLENVENRKQIIIEHMQRRDFDRLRSLVDELVEYQQANGGAKFTVKSLCDLAIEAKLIGNHRLQLELTERSINLQLDDAWSWAQYADALLNMGRPVEALEAYEQASAFGSDVVIKSGRAETLKALGRLNDALAAYDDAVSHHPESAVARRGRAETLKALGRLSESLDVYDDLIAENPEDVITKSGRAETLRALGRLNDALAAYDEAVAQHPENVVAKNGRAETFRALGRLNDALAAYDDVINQHPENVVAKSGRAETLRALGRLNDALAAYDAVIAGHPEDVVAKTGRAETLRALGRLNDALAAYDDAINQHPESFVAKRGRAEALKALGRFNESLTAYDNIIAQNPRDLIAMSGRSCVLMVLCRYEEALEGLPNEDLRTLSDWIGYHIRGMILLRMGRVNEAFQVFEQGVIGNPWPSEREFFRAMLGIVWMRQQNFPKASKVLEEVSTPTLQLQVDILRIHAYGEERKIELAKAAYDRVAANPQFQSDELTNELHRKYILGESAQHNDEWFFDREEDMLLAATSQNLLSPSLSY